MLVNTCYLHLFYLVVIHLSRLFSIGKMAPIMKLKSCKLFFKHASILSSEGASQKEIAESNKKLLLLSMVESAADSSECP